jgi:dihydroorotase (multifunctional complex type)
VTDRPDLVIDGATLVTGRGRRQASIAVRGGRIAAIGNARDLSAPSRIDAAGLLAMPGFVDTHVHLMEPASPEREDWPHGTRAAAASGVTTIVEHTHAAPVRTVADVEHKIEWAGERSVVDFGLAAHAWPDAIDEVPALWAAGVAFFKVFTCTTHGVPGFLPGPLGDLFRAVAEAGAVCLVHCEDESLTAHAEAALRAAGRTDGSVVPEWRSREAELVAVGVATELAGSADARIAVAHASHPAVVDSVQAARRRGAQVVAESCPQYFTLLESEVLTEAGRRKFTPPARARSDGDRRAMWRSLESGAIHHISSDHAPATLAQKDEGSIWDVHFGLPGMDTTAAVLIDAATRGWISWERLVESYSEAPARWYGFRDKGRLDVGADGDVVLVDPGGERTLSNEEIHSKAAWTPYAGRVVRGRVVATFLRGQRIAADGRIEAAPGTGRFVPGAGARGTDR